MAEKTGKAKGKISKLNVERWKWDNDKTEKFLEAAKGFKRQKVGEGIEWDSNKIIMREHIRMHLATEWPNDFGEPTLAEPDKCVEDMTKDEYKKYTETIKSDRELIKVGYNRVANKFKALKQAYVKDCKDGLRSGAGQLTSQFWYDCHELWGGAAGTEPLDFGLESQNTNDNACLEFEVEVNQLCGENAGVEEDNGDTSHENSGQTKKRKASFQSTKRFVDCKREKLQKGLTQKAKQDILLQHSQKQMEIQQEMLAVINKKDEGLDAAIKSMAESTALLCNTLATTMQALTSGMQNPMVVQPSAHNQPVQPQLYMNQCAYQFN